MRHSKPCQLGTRMRHYQDSQLQFLNYTKSCFPSSPTTTLKNGSIKKKDGSSWQLTFRTSLHVRPFSLFHKHRKCFLSFLILLHTTKINTDDNYLLQRILPPPSSSFSTYCHFHKALTVKNSLVKRSLIWVGVFWLSEVSIPHQKTAGKQVKLKMTVCVFKALKTSARLEHAT